MLALLFSISLHFPLVCCSFTDSDALDSAKDGREFEAMRKKNRIVYFFSFVSFDVLHLITRIMESIRLRANRMHAQLWEAAINLHRSLRLSGRVTAIRLFCLCTGNTINENNTEPQFRRLSSSENYSNQRITEQRKQCALRSNVRRFGIDRMVE